MTTSEIDSKKLEELVDAVTKSGGSEMSNYQLFVERLTFALGLPQAEFAKEETRHNDYVFERNVIFNHPDGRTSTGRIDCYKRGSFVLEAKQSAKRKPALDKAMQDQLKLEGIETTQKSGHAKRGTKNWDKIMIAARKQAEDYARALPLEHGYPPFLLIVDVGNVIEIFADFSGQGKNYAHFPDRQNYRLSMDDLLKPEVQERLSKIWNEPETLNPAKISAEVTQDIAERLAKIAKRLEKRYEAKDIAEFLMRCLFTMFAEDAGDGPADKKLIPNKGFEKLLEQMVATPDNFASALESLWKVMDTGGYAPHLNTTLKKFNGGLFKKTKALNLDEDDIRELWLASKKEWKNVEPAIFGTLLERALDPKTRSSLGAHYTPRPYVERLVIPTIIEPLRDDWEIVLDRVEDLKSQGEDEAAIQAVRDFHHKLCTTRVLDPACGTGNFLYVSLELMKLLEGEILQALDDLGDDEAKLLLDGETVSPKQFFGLEINERAVPIADLVLWIGFLKWQLRTVSAKDIPPPILNAYGTIRHQDALIAYDDKILATDEQGGLITIWDGESMKLHPITGEEIPDESKRKELYHYIKPRKANWPEAEFIVGNPPFIGNKRMKKRLGVGYVEAVRDAFDDVPDSVDFVMYWWQRCAKLTAQKKVRRAGLVTTNSIGQTFNRQVLSKYIGAEKAGLSLVYAVPNHPWVDTTEAAAVRVAFTVFEAGKKNGLLEKVTSELAGENGDFEIESQKTIGYISPGLRTGAAVTSSKALTSNEEIAFQGVILVGTGFRLSPTLAGQFKREYGDKKIRPYKIGSDLLHGWAEKYVIDVNQESISNVRDNSPQIFQHLSDYVKPDRDQNDDPKFRSEWWRWGRRRDDMFEACSGGEKFIVTCRTATNRIFSFEPSNLVPDAKIIAIASDSGATLGILSSRIHLLWSEDWARLGVGDDSNYNHSECFGNFPFPKRVPENIEQIGQKLDTFRKARFSAHSHLTLAKLYNVLERVRELENGADVHPLSDSEKDIYDAGQIAILKELHDDIDREVFAAYGWDDLADRLVGKPGATTPSPHKSEDQEAAEEELLMRLVALNQERAADEKRGIVHWLRPDFQIPRLGHKVHGQEQQEADLGEAVLAVEETKWPTDGLDQIRVLRDLLSKAEGPTPIPALSAAFKGRNTAKRRERIEDVMETLVATGAARSSEGGYFIPR